jgi:hypothetical protein
VRNLFKAVFKKACFLKGCLVLFLTVACHKQNAETHRIFRVSLPSHAWASSVQHSTRDTSSNAVLKGLQGPQGPAGTDGKPGIDGEDGEPGASDVCEATSTAHQGNDLCQATPPPGISLLTTVTLTATHQNPTEGFAPQLQWSSSSASLFLRGTPNNSLWIGFFEPHPSSKNHILTVNGVVNAAFLASAKNTAYNGQYFIVALGKGDVRNALLQTFDAGNTLGKYLVQSGATNDVLELSPNSSLAFIGRYGMGRGNGGLFIGTNGVVYGAAILADSHILKHHTPTPTNVALNHILPIQDLTPCPTNALLQWRTANNISHWECTNTNVLFNEHFQDGAITGADIANKSIEQQNVAPQNILSRHIVDESFTARHFQANTLLSNTVANETIGSVHVKNADIETRHFALNSVVSRLIAPLQILSRHIQNSAVTHSAIASNALANRHFSNNAIETRHILNGTLLDNIFTPNAIEPRHLKKDGGIVFNGTLNILEPSSKISLFSNSTSVSHRPQIRIGTTTNYISITLTAQNSLSVLTSDGSLGSVSFNGSIQTNGLTCNDADGCVDASNFSADVVHYEALEPSLQIPSNMCVFSFSQTTCPTGWSKTIPNTPTGRALGISNTTSVQTINAVLALSESVHMHQTVSFLESTESDNLHMQANTNPDTPNNPTILQADDSGELYRGSDGSYDNRSTVIIPYAVYHTNIHTHTHPLNDIGNFLWPSYYKVLVCCHD